MKKPVKPREPSRPLHRIMDVSAAFGSYSKIPLKEIERKIVGRAAVVLAVPEGELDIAQCVVANGVIRWDVSGLSEKALANSDARLQKQAVLFKEKRAQYLKRCRQYEINHNLWCAWELKSKKGKLEESMRRLQQELNALNDETKETLEKD